MSKETVIQSESEVADTVSHYVKQNAKIQGFFCRKRQNHRENTFSIQAAENKDVQDLTPENE